MGVQGVPSLLLIEADASRAGLMRQALTDHFRADCVRWYPSLGQALTENFNLIDLVLTSVHLPDVSGMLVLERLKEKRMDLPMVVVGGISDGRLAISAIRNGACDYLVTAGDYLFALPIIVAKNLEIHQTRLENQQLHKRLTETMGELQQKNKQLLDAVQKLQTIALTDPLTGLANRRAIDLEMEKTFTHCHRHGRDLACLMIDMDNFKQYNDAFGHQHGDNLLVQLAKVLEANCRRTDLAGRYGGDEFIVILPETDAATAQVAAQRIAAQFELSLQAIRANGGPSMPCTLSMGLACLQSSQAGGPEQLLAQADKALYAAKALGKAQLSVYPATPVPMELMLRSA